MARITVAIPFFLPLLSKTMSYKLMLILLSFIFNEYFLDFKSFISLISLVNWPHSQVSNLKEEGKITFSPVRRIKQERQSPPLSYISPADQEEHPLNRELY